MARGLGCQWPLLSGLLDSGLDWTLGHGQRVGLPVAMTESTIGQWTGPDTWTWPEG